MKQLEVQKWGNSAAIRLNKGLLQQLSCEIGSKFNVIIKDGGFFLKPVSNPEYTLDELLKTCTKSNTKLTDEDRAWLYDTPVGKEA